MPCTKCDNGKYKWGKNGECEYDTKEACENANSKYKEMKYVSPLGKKTHTEYVNECANLKLASQKTNLGLIEDAQKLAQKNYTAYTKVRKKAAGLTKITDTLEKLQSQFAKVKGELKTGIDDFNKSWDGMKVKTANAIKVAKELGIENEGPIKALESNITDTKKYMDIILSVKDQLEYVESRLK